MKLLKIIAISALLTSSYSFAQDPTSKDGSIIRSETSSFAAGPWDRIS
ncbi:hypothetical protein GTG28_04655 [Vibrio sp. OCN044]|uniref:Uncharacterized protein n=1 Tax=Vibrio tetraodonis subsp. pristinus TaxID=2695891 RepID=A0A6L8LQZ9_9VIBR|nr:hypothetical protein [Vibrio tetraodonis]MYM58507.1 hypothetical protein [Vibrio tetraodonis subsp. pristinus]